jgi:hypothetical protein
MTERLVFRDLAGADRALTENDRNWLHEVHPEWWTGGLKISGGSGSK